MNRLFKLMLSLAFLCAILVSCNTDLAEPIDNNVKSELDVYLNSSDFKLFNSNLGSYSSKLNFDKITKSELNENETLYKVATSFENLELGILNVVKYKDGSFKSFFELRSFSNDMKSATINYFSVDGTLQLTVQGDKDDSSQYYALSFSENPSNARMNSCTGDCYKMAKDACDGDGDCKLLCDLLDIVGYCTVSIAVACFIHCW